METKPSVAVQVRKIRLPALHGAIRYRAHNPDTGERLETYDLAGIFRIIAADAAKGKTWLNWNITSEAANASPT